MPLAAADRLGCLVQQKPVRAGDHLKGQIAGLLQQFGAGERLARHGLTELLAGALALVVVQVTI